MAELHEPVITRKEEDEIVVDHGNTMRQIKTVTLDYGAKLGKSTVRVLLRPDITFDEWQHRSRPAINDALRPLGYRLAE